jgi:hypothetical protein
VAVRSALLRGVASDALLAGRHHALSVSSPAAVLARAGVHAYAAGPAGEVARYPGAPVVAASRVGRGLVVVASRHALAALGPELRPATTPLGTSRAGAASWTG